MKYTIHEKDNEKNKMEGEIEPSFYKGMVSQYTLEKIIRNEHTIIPKTVKEFGNSKFIITVDQGLQTKYEFNCKGFHPIN